MSWITALLGPPMAILRWLSRGPLQRILDTVDKNVDAGVRRDAIRADVVKTYIENQASWLRAGGIFTLLLFAVPAALWRGSVYIYSILWCKVCVFGPVDWAIGDIPLSFREVDLWIVLASIGALGLMARK